MQTKEFVDSLIQNQIYTGSGIPDAVLNNIYSEFDNRNDFMNISAKSETTALGIASGVTLSGKNSVIFIPGNKLWSTVEYLNSFNLIYGIPLLMVVSWRGEPRIENTYEHTINGQMLFDLIDSLNLYWTFPTTQVKINYACNVVKENNAASIIVVRKDEFSDVI